MSIAACKVGGAASSPSPRVEPATASSEPAASGSARGAPAAIEHAEANDIEPFPIRIAAFDHAIVRAGARLATLRGIEVRMPEDVQLVVRVISEYEGRFIVQTGIDDACVPMPALSRDIQVDLLVAPEDLHLVTSATFEHVTEDGTRVVLGRGLPLDSRGRYALTLGDRAATISVPRASIAHGYQPSKATDAERTCIAIVGQDGHENATTQRDAAKRPTSVDRHEAARSTPHVVSAEARITWPDGDDAGRAMATHTFPGAPKDVDGRACFVDPFATQSEAFAVCFSRGDVRIAESGRRSG